MYQYLNIILVLLCLGSRLPAEESKMKPEIRAAFKFLLNEDPLAAEEQKQLALALLEDFREINDLLYDVGRAGVGAASERAGKVIKRLEEGRGQSKIHGATFGWYLILEDEKSGTLPLVIKVADGSPAADAGLLPGDVIDRCEGRGLKSDDSRNRLLLFLNQWPKSEPLELHVRRGSVADADYNGVKNVMKKLTLAAKK